MNIEIETLHKFDTEFCADSVEWFEDYFVCGTYQLIEGQDESIVSSGKHRKGRIYLFEYDEIENLLNLRDTVDTEAILDQKWLSNKLFTATSCGNIQQYELLDNQLKFLSSVNLKPEETLLALSLDLHLDLGKILVSDSKGNLTKIDSETMTIEQQWNAHGFEAWTCAFDRFRENIVYSGGDDCILNVFDLRTDCEAIGIFKNKSHEAGVTSLLSFQENSVITGSYDEKIRIFDTRKLKNCVTELNLEGGIWRLKPSPDQPNLILVACMYKNFSLVDCKYETEDFNLKLIAEYSEHKSICYGCDWSRSRRTNKDRFYHFATCSFYDHQLNLCRANIK